MEGRTVSHYRVLKKIGEGGMGEVYLAEDTSLKRKVALKFLPEYLQSDEVAQKRFLREAQSAAALDHPYICHIHEVGEAEGKSFIAMEYVEGHTLKDRLDQGRVPLEDALLIGAEVAEALEKAHKAGVVHRDLKPSNMMITTEGHAKVMDFGLAKRLTGEDATEQEITAALTREGTTLGTPAYMSPEQLQARPVDNRSDIFSFGIVLYELLTGVHPFKRETIAGTTASILKDEPGDLLQHEEGVAPLLEHMVKKMLAKDPAVRYQSIHEVNTNLAQVVKEPGKAFPRPASTRRWRLAAVSILLIAVAVGALWLLYRLVTPASESIDSLAVLPFATQGDHPYLEVLAQGIPENLISKLSPLFQVKGRISSFKFSPDSDVQEVGETLNVRAVVAGTLTVADEFFSISVELVDTKDGNNLWSEQFPHWNLEDLITKQDVFAAELAEVLQLKLTENEAAQLKRRYTNDTEAFVAYQEGRRVYKTMDRPLDTLHHFKAAIAADPDYAPAYAGISMVYGQLALWAGGIPVSEAIPEIDKNAARALELDPTLAEAFCAIGQQRVLEWDWLGAEAAFRKAIELDPSLPDGYRTLAMYFLVPTGEFDAAITQLEKALELDPLVPWINLNLGMVCLIMGSTNEAIGYFRKVRKLDDDFWLAHYFLGWAYLSKGMISDARAEFALVDSTDCKGCLPPLETPSILLALGETETAYKVLENLPQGGKRTFQEALLFTHQGQNDEAFQTLERIIDDPDRVVDLSIVMMKVSSQWDPLRDDPRFQDLLRRMNLPLD